MSNRKRYDPFAVNTKVNSGDHFISAIGKTQVNLVDEFVQPKCHYLVNQHQVFILRWCPMMNYATRSKLTEVLQLAVDLLEENQGKTLSCTSLREECRNLKTSLPTRFTCYECKFMTIKK